MTDSSSIFIAALAGFVSALLFSSIPVGPVNLTIINEGAQRGFKWAMLIGLGAATMEVIYCAIAFAGFSSFFDAHFVKAMMKVFTFVFLLFLGTRFLAAKKIAAITQFGSKAEQLEGRIEGKLQPHSAFGVGFVRVMGNLGVLATWLVIGAYLMSHEAYFTDQDWVADTLAAKTACVLGVALGTNAWFCGLSFGMSRGHGHFNEKTLLRMQHFSGLCLIAVAIFDGIHIAWQLARHKI
ncbi:MAG TPA: LysE family transporter [Verrucomicrobiae bacterium]|jgi:threonine/homoserine/homoserine lactone efflux protein